ncbi:HK97 gp10 family phage protein [Zavarzinia sp.]|uniref:HK97 gp10 family phage protein n=1 Tax=Zavarzinia sp. TaxID=2027920 RepID=UPI003BB643AB
MTVQGLAALEAKLKRRIPDAAVKRLRAAMEKSAEEIVQLMRRLVSVDSGDLRDSIGWTWGEAPKGAMVLGRSKQAIDGMTITIYAGGGDAFHALFVEFGTRAHLAGGKFKGAEIPAIAASPFFFPAWRAKRQSSKTRMARAIRQGLKEGAV